MPVHRHRLPSKELSTSSAVGLVSWDSRLYACIVHLQSCSHKPSGRSRRRGGGAVVQQQQQHGRAH